MPASRSLLPAMGIPTAGLVIPIALKQNLASRREALVGFQNGNAVPLVNIGAHTGMAVSVSLRLASRHRRYHNQRAAQRECTGVTRI